MFDDENDDEEVPNDGTEDETGDNPDLGVLMNFRASSSHSHSVLPSKTIVLTYFLELGVIHQT